ncbi:nucleoside 2-deoxyribosyltransferase [Eleftheria terrae]|uniref:nucleoside 2-deoxyribosyltransferase n=1 Tax=Eleftheria terrae TaxID=1597781 RepID=UPI00263B2A12|nr:nucleoside 2-deoxyribosyltransferase [Eleftheria terrae]WKB56042.1 nucleoside 2-deoxyribosyltransferase [Eleftheria terrae]
MKIYLASPLFTPVERRFNCLLCSELEKLATVYLPQRDGSLVAEAVERGTAAAEAARTAFCSDIEAIRNCDIIVAVLDGRVPDEGVCVEIGYAKALNKTVIGLKTDKRVLLPWGNNPMIDGCTDIWVSTVAEARAALEALDKGRAG